jgi:hypothetical protein
MGELSIAIQHTPSRAERRFWTGVMIRQLQDEKPSVPVSVIEDTRLEGCWPTHRRALEAARDVSHHVVLQDDLGLCRDFIASVKEVIKARPGNLIALYTNSPAVFRARSRRESWVEYAGGYGPAMIWPRYLIKEFLEWQDAHISGKFEFDDVRVSMWLIKTSRKAFATVPSLVEHLGCGRSTLGLNGRSKVASWYVGRNRSALAVDWSRGLSSPPRDSTLIRPEWWQHFAD